MKDYADSAEHEGLELVLTGRSSWNVSWSEPQHSGGHQRHRTRTESAGRTAKGARDATATGVRKPEAGAAPAGGTANAREMSGFGLCPELLGGGHVK